MEIVFALLIIATIEHLAHGRAINNGFTLKFNPILVKEDIGHHSTGALFAKIPQETPRHARRDFLSKAYFPRSTELGVGCTNQIAKVLFSNKSSEANATTETYEHFINIPIIPQPFSDYKIIVATAPWNMRIDGDKEAKPAVIYIVFPEDSKQDSNEINIPSIYFVKKKPSELLVLNKKEKIDPLIIMDNNRTVTGLKSKEVSKFIRFKNKLTSRDIYEVTR